jgi:biopolymer transport protein ExbD
MLMRLGRPARTVTLVPLIDVLFILLIYFMVTSIYLDLDMIPASGTPEEPGAAAGAGASETASRLVRIDPSGRVVIGGASLAAGELEEVLRNEVAGSPDLSVLILPSPQAPVQALAHTLDALVAAGVRNSRILNLEAAE